MSRRIVEQKISTEKEAKLLKISENTLSLVRQKFNSGFNKVLVVRPTGFGKSYMLANLTSTLDDQGQLKYKKCLYIYPTDVIKEDVLRTYASDNKYSKSKKEYNLATREEASEQDTRRGILNDNTDFLSYNWLTNRANDIKNGDMTKKQLRDKIKEYDLIMLDECHRVGAEGFRNAFEIFKSCLESNINLVGVTATPDRLDEENIRDIFGERNQIKRYELKDAIKDGLLQKFDYVYAINNSENYIKSAIKELNKIREHNGDNDITESEIRELREFISSHNNMSSILKKIIKLPLSDDENDSEVHVGYNNYAKFIVFMNNRNHIHNQADNVFKWFKQAYPTMDIRNHVIITKISDDTPYIINNKTVKVKDTNELDSLVPRDNTIDLIFCVDKLTMGYHVESITGVVLMANTESAIKYNQQIGRCFSVRSNNKPVIFHIVDNFLDSPSLVEVDKSFKGKKIDLPMKLDKQCVDLYDFTKEFCKQASKIVNQDYTKIDKIVWLYNVRHMSAVDIAKTSGAKLDTIVKILLNNRINLVDKNEILKHKNLLSAEVIKEIK